MGAEKLTRRWKVSGADRNTHDTPFTLRQLHARSTAEENFTYDSSSFSLSVPLTTVHFHFCVDRLQMMKYDKTLMSELVVSAEGELYISPERSIARHNGQS
jgi:hypothetical protein